MARRGDIDPERKLNATKGFLQISQIKISDTQTGEMHIFDTKVSFLTLSFERTFVQEKTKQRGTVFQDPLGAEVPNLANTTKGVVQELLERRWRLLEESCEGRLG